MIVFQLEIGKTHVYGFLLGFIFHAFINRQSASILTSVLINFLTQYFMIGGRVSSIEGCNVKHTIKLIQPQSL